MVSRELGHAVLLTTAGLSPVSGGQLAVGWSGMALPRTPVCSHPAAAWPSPVHGMGVGRSVRDTHEAWPQDWRTVTDPRLGRWTLYLLGQLQSDGTKKMDSGGAFPGVLGAASTPRRVAAGSSRFPSPASKIKTAITAHLPAHVPPAPRTRVQPDPAAPRPASRPARACSPQRHLAAGRACPAPWESGLFSGKIGERGASLLENKYCVFKNVLFAKSKGLPSSRHLVSTPVPTEDAGRCTSG